MLLCRSQPVRAVVPQADPKLVYDIKYYTRDARRAHMLVGGTNVTELVTEKIDPKVPAKRPAGVSRRIMATSGGLLEDAAQV